MRGSRWVAAAAALVVAATPVVACEAPGWAAGHRWPAALASSLPPGSPAWAADFSTSVPLGSWSGCTANGPIQTSHCTGLPAAVDKQWWAYPAGWKDTSKHGTYNPSKTLSVSAGQLHLHLNGTNVSAPVPKLPGSGRDGGFLYGSYSITWRASATAPGYKTAWLLWPDSEKWPTDGEVDFPEANLYGGALVSAFMHRQGGSSGGDQDAYTSGVVEADGRWHTSTVRWAPGDMQFELDGQVIGHSTARVPNTPMHLVLQSETSLDGVVPRKSATADIDISSLQFWTP